MTELSFLCQENDIRVRELRMSLSKCRMYDVLMELSVYVTTYKDLRTTVGCTDGCMTYGRMHEAGTNVPCTGVHMNELCTYRTYRRTEVTYGRKDVRYQYVVF